MENKELQNLFPNKQVMIEKEWDDSDIYSVSYTNNGRQWSQVFRGSYDDAIIILNAYAKIGYKKGGTKH